MYERLVQNGYMFVARVISISYPTLELLQDRELEVVRPGTVALGAEHFHGVFLFGAMYGLKMVCRLGMGMEKRTR